MILPEMNNLWLKGIMIKDSRLVASFLQVQSWIIFCALEPHPFIVWRITDRSHNGFIETTIEHLLINLLEVNNTGI